MEHAMIQETKSMTAGPSGYDTDVLVIGTGPMGSTTALALARQGVRVHAVSKRNWLADTPRAHITNQRAMEVLRSLGIEEQVRRQATPWESMGDTLFTTSLAGPEIARLQTWGTGDDRFGDYRSASPCGMLDIPQTLLEPILVDAAARSGAQISFNTEYLAHEQDGDGVTATLKDRLSGHCYRRRARYLVGADGARSKVAEDAGLAFEGVLARAGTVYAQFRADLSRYTAHRPSILYWIMNPDAGFGEIGMGLLRAVRPWSEWIAGWGFDMALGEPDLGHDGAMRKIRALVGDPDFECELVSVAPWYVNRQYALAYSKGRVFCGGDAVHRHPPSSGLGSNTSVQDAFNLAWKLAFAVKGHASDGLLSSYSQERAPVGRQIVERANQSRLDYAPLRAAVAPEAAADPLAASLRKIADPTPAGVETRIRIEAALHLKNYEFNAHGVEMNQRYRSVAVLDEPEPEAWTADPQLFEQSTTRPGAKIPHAWLVDRHGTRISTLDVVGSSSFTLVTGPAGRAWAEAVTEMASPVLTSLVIGAGEFTDPYRYWHRKREIHEAGALLVRPDGIVAWRSLQPVWRAREARRLLERVLSQILAPASQTEKTLEGATL